MLLAKMTLVHWYSVQCGARGCCRIIPPRFLAESCKRRLNQGRCVSVVCLVVYFLWFVLCLSVCFCDLYWIFFLIVCLWVTVNWLAVKTASEMTYTVSGWALNSAESSFAKKLQFSVWFLWLWKAFVCWCAVKKLLTHSLTRPSLATAYTSPSAGCLARRARATHLVWCMRYSSWSTVHSYLFRWGLRIQLSLRALVVNSVSRSLKSVIKKKSTNTFQ